jgi:hypothetical protein
LLRIDGQSTTSARVEFESAIIRQHAAAFQAVIRCHLNFSLQDSNAKSR